MRQKQPRVILSFHTTAEAIATETVCRRQGLEGKLISVPRSITSDCGLAWSAPPELEEQLRNLLTKSSVEPAGFHHLTV